MSGIEYVDEPAPVVEARRARGPGRAAVVVALGLALVALLVVRAVTSGGRHETQPKPVTYRLAACDSAEVVPVVNVDTGQFVTLHVAAASLQRCTDMAARCPEADDGQNACSTTTTLPAALVRSVRDAFPGARVLDARTEFVRENGALWFRYVLFRLPGARELAVQVAHGHPLSVVSGEWDNGSRLLGCIGREAHGGTVFVTYSAPSGSASVLQRQYRLAGRAALATVTGPSVTMGG